MSLTILPWLCHWLSVAARLLPNAVMVPYVKKKSSILADLDKIWIATALSGFPN